MDVTLAEEKLLMLMLMLITLWMSACKRFVQIEHLIEKAPNIEVHCGAWSNVFRGNYTGKFYSFMTSVSSDPQVFKSHHYSASLSSNERIIQFYVSHHQEREDLNKQNTCTSVSEKVENNSHSQDRGKPRALSALGMSVAQGAGNNLWLSNSCSLGPIATYAAARRGGAPHKVG